MIIMVISILVKLIRVSSYLKWRSASVSELILTSSDPDGLRCRFELNKQVRNWFKLVVVKVEVMVLKNKVKFASCGKR